MAKCKKCGIEFSSKFCPNCGTKAEPETQATAQVNDEISERLDTAYNSENAVEAKKFYMTALISDRENAQAWWGLFIMDYGLKDKYSTDGPFRMRITAENALLLQVDDKVYKSVKNNRNYINALQYADGQFKKRVAAFSEGLEERYKAYTEAVKNWNNLLEYCGCVDDSDLEYTDKDYLNHEYYKNALKAAKESFNRALIEKIENAGKKNDKTNKSQSENKNKSAAKKTEQPDKDKSCAPLDNKDYKDLKYSVGSWKSGIIAAAFCCIPLILELLFIFLIPKLEFLNGIDILCNLGWEALTLPLKVSFLALVVLGVAFLVFALLKKSSKPLVMATQLVNFAIFCISAYTVGRFEVSATAQWILAVTTPIAMIIACLYYVYDRRYNYGIGYNFSNFIPLAFAVAENAVFYLGFSAMFKTAAPTWVVIVATVIVFLAITATVLFVENIPWIAVGIQTGLYLISWLLYWIISHFKDIVNVILSVCGGVAGVIIVAFIIICFVNWYRHKDDYN